MPELPMSPTQLRLLLVLDCLNVRSPFTEIYKCFQDAAAVRGRCQSQLMLLLCSSVCQNGYRESLFSLFTSDSFVGWPALDLVDKTSASCD